MEGVSAGKDLGAPARRLSRRMARGHRIPERLRWAHRLYATWHGLAWQPCPLCGCPFGGHEWRDIGGKSSTLLHPGSTCSGTAICPACTRAGLGDGWRR